MSESPAGTRAGLLALEGRRPLPHGRPEAIHDHVHRMARIAHDQVEVRAEGVAGELSRTARKARDRSGDPRVVPLLGRSPDPPPDRPTGAFAQAGSAGSHPERTSS